MMFLLGQYDDPKVVKEYLETDLRGGGINGIVNMVADAMFCVFITHLLYLQLIKYKLCLPL